METGQKPPGLQLIIKNSSAMKAPPWPPQPQMIQKHPPVYKKTLSQKLHRAKRQNNSPLLVAKTCLKIQQTKELNTRVFKNNNFSSRRQKA